MYSRQPFTFDRVVRMIISCLVIFAVLWLIYTLRGVLLPFFVACLVAYILELFVQCNRQLLHLKGRVVAIFVTLFEATFLFVALCYLLVPMIVSEMEHMAHLLRQYSETRIDTPFLPESVHEIIKKYIDFDYLSQLLGREDRMKMF